ncbi:MAG: hypothetical protein AVDCRST_MAG13-2686, partial [uncultured Solirubrobacteraceae bacterium]
WPKDQTPMSFQVIKQAVGRPGSPATTPRATPRPSGRSS